MNALASSDLALAFLISCWAKATLLLAGAWLVVFVLRQRSSAAQRHHVWAAAMLASLALPFFSLLLPAWHSATLGSAAALWIPARANTTSSGSEAIPSVIVIAASGSAIFNKLAVAALFAWALGFSFVLLRLLAGLARLAWGSAHAKPLFDGSWSTVLEISKFTKSTALSVFSKAAVRSPCRSRGGSSARSSCCHRAPSIGRKTAGIVLSHELAHIAPATTGSCRFAPNSPAPPTGSIPSRGWRPHACARKANAPAMTRSYSPESPHATTPANYSISQGILKTPALPGRPLLLSRAQQILKGDLPPC